MPLNLVWIRGEESLQLLFNGSIRKIFSFQLLELCSMKVQVFNGLSHQDCVFACLSRQHKMRELFFKLSSHDCILRKALRLVTALNHLSNFDLSFNLLTKIFTKALSYLD